MNLKLFIFHIIVFSMIFNFSDCFFLSLQKSELPREMPENTEMSFSENGGISPYAKMIKIKELDLTVEETSVKREKNTWTAKITEEEKIELYQIFVENKFDLIKNEENKTITYDAGSEGVSLKAGDKFYNVSYGANAPLSYVNLERYKDVANAINELEAKYQNKSKPVSPKHSVLKYDSSYHKWIFKFSTPADLTPDDLAQIEKLVNQAVKKNNSKQKESRQIKDLSEYKYQYVAVFNRDNEKEVWVNAFCNAFETDWKKEIVSVKDGGSCYFNLKINLSSSTFYDLSVNGEA